MEQRPQKILIVDDEPSIRDSLTLLLSDSYEVVSMASGEEALLNLERGALPDLLLLDVMMPGSDGLSVLRALKAAHPEIPVVLLTGAGNVRGAVEAIKLGAADYLSKPFDVSELKRTIESALRSPPVVERPARPSRTEVVEVDADFGSMVGQSSSMAGLFGQIDTIAGRDTTILITGESGTGKELVAREIHRRSMREHGPFIAINCAAIPETLIESELFGHEKGAFTHAVERRIGQFELADGGTLFLDEIGELSPAVQVKLLRFLQERELHRVGRAKAIKVDVRVIAATNKDLDALVREGKFRQDLFYRLNVIHLAIPALRERHEDVELLIHNFLSRYSQHYGGRLLSFSPEAKALLLRYSWPGNVRELGNVVESLMALCPHDVVDEQDLPKKIREKPRLGPEARLGTLSGLAFEEAERMFETEMIVKALKRANFVQTRAAEMLGITRRILKYKMDKLSINERGEVLSTSRERES